MLSTDIIRRRLRIRGQIQRLMLDRVEMLQRSALGRHEMTEYTIK